MAEAIDDVYLRALVLGSATLAERLSGAFEPVRDAQSMRLADARLARWRAKLTGVDPSAFERRLAWLDTTPEGARERLGTLRFLGPLPEWTGWIVRGLARATGPAPACPFGALVAPFVEAARDVLEPTLTGTFAPQAIDALLADLAEALSHLGAPVFYLEFAMLRGDANDPRSTALYDGFVTNLLAGGMRRFFADYPVLARLLATTVADFVANTRAMAEAVEADRADLARIFAAGADLGKVADLRTSLSDRHNGGRTVSSLRFANGLRLVYKPRNIAVERAWFDLLAQIEGEGCEFARLRVLARDDHGWVEFAAPAACSDADEVARYYRRAGMLLAMLYVLEASDCFFENIVARGGWPLLIDMETLMHPVVRGEPDLSPAESAAGDILFNSVFRAGFLPAWELGPDGRCVDISGLAAAPGQTTSYVRRVWHHAGTDAMRLDQQPIAVDSRDHLPSLAGVPARAADHADAIIDGFALAYRRILADAAYWAGPDGFARRFAGSEIRFVFHATRIYGLVLKRLGAPRHLRDGVERSIELDVISRFYLESHKQARFRDILDAETAALDRLDVPKFTVGADARTLRLPTGAVLPDLFERSAIERVQRRVLALSEEDLHLQQEFIRASLELSSTDVQHAPTLAPAAPATPAAVSPSDMVAEAQAIGAMLSARAILSGNGATWIAPQLLPGANRHELRPLRMDLYSGLAGVALFFAALDRVTGTGRDLALAALAPLRHYLRIADPARMVREGYTLGAATGAGAFVAALGWCGELLDAPELYRSARAFAARIAPEWIGDDDAYDVMAGSAGTIHGLLCLHRRSPDPGVLAQAVACGEHLLASAQSTGAGIAWPAPGGGLPLTGFSHGSAGIAAALHRLASAASAPRFATAATHAIAQENTAFDPDPGNWRDHRHGGRHYMTSWCHGAPGIGLGRAIGADAHACASDLDAALRATERHGIGDRDGLCCGALGRADLFLVHAAGHETPAAALARDWAAQVLMRKRRTGSYRLTGRDGEDFFDPSFFQGLSGIGYQLLRTADPARLPSVLSWA